jgi:hypothetical protein
MDNLIELIKRSTSLNPITSAASDGLRNPKAATGIAAIL